MKNINLFICLIVMLFPSFKGNAQSWFVHESITTSDLLDLYFISSEIGFAVGTNGVILKTTNGGDQWVLKSSGTNDKLLSICFPDSLTGFAISNTQVLKSTDGGESWQLQDTVMNTYLRDMHFITQDTGFIFGNGRIFSTTDRGINWIKEYIPGIDGPSFWATDFKNMYVGSYNYLILKSIDGGVNWFVSQNYGLGNAITSMFFTSQNVGYAVTTLSAQGYYGSFVLKTSNGGLDWNTTYKKENSTLNSIFFINEKTGYVVGNQGEILKTIDAGKNWINLNTNVETNLKSVFFTNTEIGYAVGTNGTIIKTINGGVGVSELNESKASVKLYPNPVLNLLHIDLPNNLNQESEILIYTITGTLIHRYQTVDNENILNLSNLLEGIYLLKFISKDQTEFFTIVKQ